MKHCMIDLETLGTKPGSIFLSIAAVEFEQHPNHYSLMTGHEFKVNIDLKSAMDAGLKVDASTLEWWLTQRPEVMAMMFKDTNPLDLALDKFSEFKAVTGFINAWGNSAAFDLSILRAGYESIGKHSPWSHWQEMCYRTFRTAFANGHKLEKDPESMHDPIYDCYYQIRMLNFMCERHEINI